MVFLNGAGRSKRREDAFIAAVDSVGAVRRGHVSRGHVSRGNGTGDGGSGGVPIECDISGVNFECLAGGGADQERALRRCGYGPAAERCAGVVGGDGSAQAEQGALPAGVQYIRGRA